MEKKGPDHFSMLSAFRETCFRQPPLGYRRPRRRLQRPRFRHQFLFHHFSVYLLQQRHYHPYFHLSLFWPRQPQPKS